MRDVKEMTNVEFVTDLMEHSQYGALAQMFVMDALGKWSARVAETPIEELRTRFGESTMISADAWHGVAQEIQAKLAMKYGN